MKKEQTYVVEINGNEHEILIAQSRTKYELLVDDQLACQINMTNYEDNVEKDVVIDGKVCQFVVYGDEPDLVVDGVMQIVEAKERNKTIFHKSVLMILGMIQILVGTLCIYFWFALTQAGDEFIGGNMGLVCAILFLAAGVVEFVLGLKKRHG